MQMLNLTDVDAVVDDLVVQLDVVDRRKLALSMMLPSRMSML